MEKYIVKYKSKVNGNYIETFHVSISETNPNLKTMNTYFFENIFHIGKVIKK